MECLKLYNDFSKQLKTIFANDLNLEYLDKLSDENKIDKCKLFVSLITDFDLFIKSKIKLFSHKNNKNQELSESLFGDDCSLRNVLNNQPDYIKKTIWNYLHNIYLQVELLKPVDEQNKNYIKTLTDLTCDTEDDDEESEPKSRNKINDLLGVDVNDQTTFMLDDIVGSFEDILNSKNSNPLSSILDISNKMSSKYGDKINNGDIEIDKLMQTITKKIPGMDKMMDKMGNIGSMMGGGKKEPPKEKVIIDESFSTANVSVGEIVETKSSFDIGSILKVADGFGVIPGKSANKSPDKSTEQNPEPGLDLEGLGNIEGMPDIGKMMNLLKNMDNSNPDDVKKEMEDIMQNMGIDFGKLSEQLEDFNKIN